MFHMYGARRPAGDDSRVSTCGPLREVLSHQALREPLSFLTLTSKTGRGLSPHGLHLLAPLHSQEATSAVSRGPW